MLLSLRRALMRVRITEVLKFVVAAALGFTLRVMFETSQRSAPCPSACGAGHILPHLDVNALGDQLREPYRPLSAADVIEYRFVDVESVFDSHGAVPRLPMKKYHQGDLRELLAQTKNYFTSEGRPFTLRRLRSAYERIDPLRGKEYVLDLELRSPAAQRPGLHLTEFYRVSLVKPFGSTQLLRRQHVAKLPAGALTLVVAMHIGQLPAFRRFLAIFESFVTRQRWDASLRFVVSRPPGSAQFDDAMMKLQREIKDANRRAVDPKAKRIRFQEIEEATFRPHIARHRAIKELPTDQGIIITDLNVNLTGEFYFRCEATIQSAQTTIYAPIPFSLFKTTDMSKAMPVKQPKIDEATGYWDHDNLQTLCLRKDAYDRAGAYEILDTNRDAWSENEALYGRFVAQNFKIIRSVDPAVFVSYHEHTCGQWAQYGYMMPGKCRQLLLKSYGSRTKLANKLIQ